MVLLMHALLPFLIVSAVQARKFTDDRGITHDIVGKPKIVTFTRTAVTLSHFGKKILRCYCCSVCIPTHTNTLHSQDWASTNSLVCTASISMTDRISNSTK